MNGQNRYYWDLTIDTVAVINLVLAVGLAVDYAAHVAHSFMIKAGTKDERVVQVKYTFVLYVDPERMSNFLSNIYEVERVIIFLLHRIMGYTQRVKWVCPLVDAAVVHTRCFPPRRCRTS